MVDVWFTSDTHFGHVNILEYEKEARPFSTIDEMNEVLVDRWNKVVKPKDIIYHLGDFAFGKHNVFYASRLNGIKRLVMGNHDTYPAELYLNHFHKLYGTVFYERCILSHVPVHPSVLGSRWLLNVHGHLHSKKIQLNGLKEHCEFFGINLKDDSDQNYFNVSCEQNNLTPIHRDAIMERIKELKC